MQEHHAFGGLISLDGQQQIASASLVIPQHHLLLVIRTRFLLVVPAQLAAKYVQDQAQLRLA